MYQRVITYTFFGALMLTGILFYKDFGIPSDAIWSREMGLVNLKYIAETFNLREISSRLPTALPDLKSYPDGDHGPVFELFAISLEWILGLHSERDIYQYRNLLTYCFGCLGAYAVFTLARRRFNSWTTGLLASLILVCTPRIFWESFYNSKDIVFMSMFAIAMNTLIVSISSTALRYHVAHGIVSAIAFDIRVAGILIPIFSIGFAFINLYASNSNREIILKNLLCYLVVFLFVSVAFWPWLWINPIEHILSGFKSSANFQRLVIWILYRGHYYPTTDLPWHYLPWNLLISIPLLFIILAAIGILAPIVRLIKLNGTYYNTFEFKQDCIFYLTVLMPIIGAIIIKPTLYNGWRHFYFIYPALIIIFLHGYFFVLQSAIKLKSIKLIMCLTLSTTITLTLIESWKNYPFSNNYFNFLAGSNWAQRYSIDYWGISTYQAIKYILEHDPSSEIKIKPLQCINADSALVLFRQEDAARIKFVYDNTVSDYMLLNYIFLHEDQKKLWDDIKLRFPIYHELMVNHQPILSILRERGEHEEAQVINSTGFRTC